MGTKQKVEEIITPSVLVHLNCATKSEWSAPILELLPVVDTHGGDAFTPESNAGLIES